MTATPNTTVEDRLVRLEEMAAHQSATIEELSRQLADQWRLSERLRADLAQMLDHIDDVTDNVGPSPNQKPPHY